MTDFFCDLTEKVCHRLSTVLIGGWAWLEISSLGSRFLAKNWVGFIPGNTTFISTKPTVELHAVKRHTTHNRHELTMAIDRGTVLPFGGLPLPTMDAT